MKENHSFKSEIREVVRRMSAVALCVLIVTASAEQGREDAKKALKQLYAANYV